MIKVPEFSLIELEKNLNKVAFDEIPLGGTIVNSLIIQLQNGNGNWSMKDRIRDFITLFYLIYRGVSNLRKRNTRYTEFPNQYKNKGLLTFVSSKHSVFKMNYVIWKNYRKNELLCFLDNDNLLTCFYQGEQPLYITKNDLPSIDLKAWRQSFRKIRQPACKIIKTFLRNNDLPAYVGRRIMNILMVQTQYLEAFEQLLKTLQPKFILVEYDRHSWSSCLILAAKKLSIPTFTMMHGVVNNQSGYMPMLADYLFCWGEHQKRLLEEYGGNPERLIVTGATQLDTLIKISKQTVRKRLGITDNKKVVLLATNPVSPVHRHGMVQMFCQAIQEFEDIVGIVRLHPSEEIDFYAEYVKKYPKILFDKNDLISYEESFALADIVCIYNSAYGLDAALKGLPVMIINVADEYLGQAKDFIKHGDFPVANSTAELTEQLNSYLNNQDYRRRVNENIKIYARRYCKTFENKAAHNMICFINSKVEASNTNC